MITITEDEMNEFINKQKTFGIRIGIEDKVSSVSRQLKMSVDNHHILSENGIIYGIEEIESCINRLENIIEVIKVAGLYQTREVRNEIRR